MLVLTCGYGICSNIWKSAEYLCHLSPYSKQFPNSFWPWNIFHLFLQMSYESTEFHFYCLLTWKNLLNSELLCRDYPWPKLQEMIQSIQNKLQDWYLNMAYPSNFCSSSFFRPSFIKSWIGKNINFGKAFNQRNIHPTLPELEWTTEKAHKSEKEDKSSKKYILFWFHLNRGQKQIGH